MGSLPIELERLDPELVLRIGRTPLVPIEGLPEVPPAVSVLGKAEWENPGGSVKDRAAWGMVQAAERDGSLRPGATILDATSGNTGIALAWIGAARGYPVTVCLPANAGAERKRLLAALGAQVILTDPLEGTDGAQRAARSLAAREPARYVYLDQYANPANWRAHYHGTANEIWEQTDGKLTHLVAGIGTSGTLVGCSRRLRELAPAVRVVGVQPAEPMHGLEGLKHLASVDRPAIYDPSAHDQLISVETEAALAMGKELASRGLRAGPSAAAAVIAGVRVARELSRGVVVVVLPDGADRYGAAP
jgi:cysteine synthase B